MSDLFQDAVPAEFVKSVWAIMEQAHWHIFQVLTKRPGNMLRIIADNNLPALPNVWLGTSVESGKFKGRIALLRRVPARIRFISFEPLIGPIRQANLKNIHWAIVGGESGPKARPMKQEWVEEIQLQCAKQDVSFFFKQWGGTNKKSTGRVYRGRTWDEYPKDFQAARLAMAS